VRPTADRPDAHPDTDPATVTGRGVVPRVTALLVCGLCFSWCLFTS
jgi:hypothetical protein